MEQRYKDSLVECYDKYAKQRESNGSLIEDWKKNERMNFLDTLRKSGERDFKLLEIGCGHGRDSLFFKQLGLFVTAIDISPVMVSLCLKKGIEAQIMDMAHMAFKSNMFDTVYALNSFLHLSKSEFVVTLNDVHRILKPGGIFYLGMYGNVNFEGIWHDDNYSPKRFFSFYTDKNLISTLKPWFNILSFKSINLSNKKLNFQSVILSNKVAMLGNNSNSVR